MDETNSLFYFQKTLFNSVSWTDTSDLFEIVKECILGSCTAIIVNEEIIYNTYDPTRIASRILMEDLYREQFARNPKLLICPYENLKIMIYMFNNHPWSLIITFNNGIYKIECFTN